MSKRWESVLLPLVAATLFLGAWQAGVVWSHTRIFPAPLDVVRGMRELAQRGLLLRYTADSLLRVGTGYLTAILLGIPTGLILGWYPQAARAVNPVIQILRPISPLAWIPLAIVWFGIGNTSSIFLIFLASFFPVVVATVNGVRNVPPMFRNAGQNFGLTPVALLRRVIFPAALPQVLVGFGIAPGIAWLGGGGAGMIAAHSGLGCLII